MDRARAAGSLVAYTLPEGGTIIDPGIAPHDGEVVEQKPGGPDKFLGSDLDARLKASGIKTVIITGTSAQGVGIGTGSASAQRGYNVIYPVDGVASESAFRELYAAWHMGVRRAARHDQMGDRDAHRHDQVLTEAFRHCHRPATGPARIPPVSSSAQADVLVFPG